jgi:5,10-methylene-tetrahydrofolate dehydrogenase/methenyl tetrahydrofolate cyclohydrolase
LSWLPTLHEGRKNMPQKANGELAGKAVAITGASSGIGEAIALACAQAGASVALAARRADSSPLWSRASVPQPAPLPPYPRM